MLTVNLFSLRRMDGRIGHSDFRQRFIRFGFGKATDLVIAQTVQCSLALNTFLTPTWTSMSPGQTPEECDAVFIE